MRYYTRVSLRDVTEARARLNTIENRTLIHFNLHDGVTNLMLKRRTANEVGDSRFQNL